MFVSKQPAGFTKAQKRYLLKVVLLRAGLAAFAPIIFSVFNLVSKLALQIAPFQLKLALSFQPINMLSHYLKRFVRRILF